MSTDEIRTWVGRVNKRKVPKQYQDATVDNTPRAQRVYDSLTKNPERLVFVTGTHGCGKTRLLYAAAKQADVEGRMFRIELAPQMILGFQKVASVDMYELDADIYELQKYPGTLAIDDLGAEKTTDFALQCLYLVLAFREQWGLPTVITSNLSVEALGERLGDRIGSRLLAGKTVELGGHDRRAGTERS